MKPESILRPEITVPLARGAVIMRDLPGQDALEFLRRLAVIAKDLIKDNAKADGSINLASLLPKLAELISTTEDLSTFLITKSVGKDEKWLADYGLLETMALLDGALEVNLSDGLIALGKGVAGRLQKVLSANKAPTSSTPAPAISSSPKDTTPAQS